MENIIIQLGFFLFLLLLGYLAGSYAEKKHYKSIREREEKFISLPAVTIKKGFNENKKIISSKLVTGSVVISLDYFKKILAILRNIVGGNVSSYETLIDRGRREAILRMKESFPDADIIVNTRIETSSISKRSNSKNSIGSVEVFAYGTAIKYGA